MLKNRLRHYSLARTLYANALFFRFALREGIWRVRKGFSHSRNALGFQRLVKWNVPFPQFKEPYELIIWLQARGIHLNEGRHTIYIPPQKGLDDLIPTIVGFYPPNSGFKILKDFRSPADSNYLTGTRLFVRTKLIGNPQDQLVTANYMYSLGIGPRVWDVCCWEGDKTSYTVFVLSHVTGVSPTREQCMEFIKELQQINSSSHLCILVPNWKQSIDFICPNCNHNLVYSKDLGRLQYVDFQNFCIDSPPDWSKEIVDNAKDIFHFGNARPFRGSKYLYQSIPGISTSSKRNMSKRWAFFMAQLRRAGLDLQGRVVLDIGCNAGIILHSSLVEGADWGLGWDRPNVTQYAQEILFSLGSSRFHLKGVDLNSRYALEEDIPINILNRLKEAVVFYLSVREHIGLLHSLQRIPWRALLYEGHQKEQLEDVPMYLEPLLTKNTSILASSCLADGDCSTRPIVILLRQ